MWCTVDIVEAVKPKWVIWENVKNLLSKKHVHNFNEYLEIMNQLGYNNYYKVLNAKDYGIPQNRERVYTISIRKDIDIYDFKFPEKQELKLRLKDILEEEVEKKYYISEKMINGFLKHNENHNKKGTGFIWKPKTIEDIANNLRANAALCPTDNTIIDKCLHIGDLCNGKWDKINESCRRVYSENGLSPSVHTCQGGNTEPKVGIIGNTNPSQSGQNGNVYNSEMIAPTITTNKGEGIKITENIEIRKLTPKECWRLMGFTDTDIDKCIAAGISNTQLYKQVGNSIVVNVLEEIFKNLFDREIKK